MSGILVVGGAGFLGRHAIPALLAAGHRVRALQRSRAILPASHPALEVVEGELAAGLQDGAFADCSMLLHLAGASTPGSTARDAAADIGLNLLPTIRLLEGAAGSGIQRIVFASSGGTIYGRPRSLPISEDHPTFPTCPYGVGKLAAEHLIRLWAERLGRHHVILRVANPYGPFQPLDGSQGVIGAWIGKALAGGTGEVWGDGTVVRDYLHVADVARGIVGACGDGFPSGIYNLGSGTGHSLLEIADAIGSAHGRPLLLAHHPGRDCDVPVNVLDARRFCAASGWIPGISLTEGIRDMLTWARSLPEHKP